ncbi:MAP2K3 isoform 4 [Pan troglodytes]|uniref:Mitogen-activated protein kinase kinase 3 n=3 Tax=Hominidae TaxID=9604 RepID=X6RB39_HUMAN|nr:MAP2K3 isoform 4 [Pan troglodytes]PNJ03306.1 MAP2K3 isoform 4 [Pongo abelii]
MESPASSQPASMPQSKERLVISMVTIYGPQQVPICAVNPVLSTLQT